jgi:hypothetical protein
MAGTIDTPARLFVPYQEDAVRGLLKWTDKQAPYQVKRANKPARTITLDDLRRQIDEATRRYDALARRVTGADPALVQCEQAVRDALNLFDRNVQEAESALTGGDPDRAARRLEQAFANLQQAHAAVNETGAEYGG